ncbi:Sel1 repeat-containing protein [Cardiosporidium cionae]|uniref:Sel1 repeat-containing protein n=1 Tax=Cardiosporidium cionae TaxID=476202 RepID=A0ABQ7JGG1_9APIC|nr:Sel1 repeat-containing protein [Cardiosporidium cionae]|eukprot:KAF8822745.1 Sel1 repeat-containing protein [Cardiosporidium cionae]
MFEDFLNLKDFERISKNMKGRNEDLNITGKRQNKLQRKRVTEHAKGSLVQLRRFAFCISPLCEQLKDLSAKDLSQQKAEALGALAYLFLFGVPDSKGILNFPEGWPRNIDLSILSIKMGLQIENCSMCHALSGFLFAIGFPPFVNHTKGIMPSEESSFFIPSLYFEDGNSYQAENMFTTRWGAYSRQIDRIDHAMVAYTLASQRKNFIGQLALSYYLKNGLGNRSFTLKEQELYFTGTQHREGNNASEICLYATVPLIDVAAKSISESIIKLPQDVLLRSKSPSDNEAKKYTSFVQTLAKTRHHAGLRVLGNMYYAGYEAGGINRNIQQAAELWDEAALRGDAHAALARAMLFWESQYGTAAEADYFLQQVILYSLFSII